MYELRGAFVAVVFHGRFGRAGEAATRCKAFDAASGAESAANTARNGWADECLSQSAQDGVGGWHLALRVDEATPHIDRI